MSYLGIEGKKILIFGLSNRKSIAWSVGKTLEENGAEVIYSVRSEERRESLAKLLAGRRCEVCDVEESSQIEQLAIRIGSKVRPLAGIVHSIAFADYSEGFKAFHETQKAQYLQATTISSFSIVEIARAFKPYLDKNASVLAISISSQVLAESYGFMAPIKAALDSSMRFLAKSFSQDTRIRFNTVNAGPLKTKSSAGIPGYLENYLYAEKLTLRKQALSTQEVADTAVFLLSPRSSGINAQGIVVNQGMDLNYFDKEVVARAVQL